MTILVIALKALTLVVVIGLVFRAAWKQASAADTEQVKLDEQALRRRINAAEVRRSLWRAGR